MTTLRPGVPRDAGPVLAMGFGPASLAGRTDARWGGAPARLVFHAPRRAAGNQKSPGGAVPPAVEQPWRNEWLANSFPEDIRQRVGERGAVNTTRAGDPRTLSGCRRVLRARRTARSRSPFSARSPARCRDKQSPGGTVPPGNQEQ